jgi:hypothetical protein
VKDDIPEAKKFCSKCGQPMEVRKVLVTERIYGCPNNHLYQTVSDRPWHYEGVQTVEGVYPMERVDEKNW